MSVKFYRSELEAALHLIKKKKKREYLGYGNKMDLKVWNLCSRDGVSGSNIKPGSTLATLSKTQQLLYQLNRAVLRHDWEAVATCTEFLLNLNGKVLPIVWKAMVLVLLNHKKSTPDKIKEFFEICLGIRREEEQINFLNELLSFPEDLSVYTKQILNEEDMEFVWDYSTEEEAI